MRNLLIPALRLATAVMLLLPVAPASAQTVVTKRVTWNVDALAGHAAAPYSLNFQLTDGTGLGNGNVTVQVLNAPFTGFTLTNSSFLEQANATFVPLAGVPLEFDVKVTYAGVDDPTPDQFSFAALDNLGLELPTIGPADALATFDILESGVAVNAYHADPTRQPAAGGNAIDFAAPVITDLDASPVPEPVSLLMFLPALAVVVRLRRVKPEASI